MTRNAEQRDEGGNDPYLFTAQQLQEGRTVAEVRKRLVAEGVPAEEARSMVLNVYAAQKLQEGRTESEVRKLLLAEKDVTPEEADTIVAALRTAIAQSTPDAPARNNALLGWGVIFLIFGVGSFILPLMGVQFKLLALFGEATPYIGGGLAVIGAVLVVLSFVTGGARETGSDN
jgi:hypothetical protein